MGFYSGSHATGAQRLSYKNPHRREMIQATGCNHKSLKGRKAQYGADNGRLLSI